MSKQIQPHILQFYQLKKLLGSGAYGHVWKVTDKQSKQTLALKKIFDAFQNSTDAQRTYRQISLLHQMQHINIIKLHKVIKSKNKKDLYLVFQFMQSDLHSLIGQNILTIPHMKFVLYQVLKALKYIHSAQLIHRDLKPSNILINSDCEIKLCDFGLARSLAHQENQQNILSEQVATRWYRSPEILLNSKDYSKPTDIWSVGCIMAQLLIGQPIFQGDSTLNQLQKIIQFTGMPSKYNVDSLKSQSAQNIINSLSVRKKPLKQYFKNITTQTKQLIEITIKMLQFNPSKRPSVQQLLNNKIFIQFQKNNTDESQQICHKFIIPQIDDNIKLTLQQYRSIIYKDIQRRYPEFNDMTRIKGFCSMINNKNNTSFVEKNKNKSITREKNHKSLMNKDNNNNNNNNNKSVHKDKSIDKHNSEIHKTSSNSVLVKTKKNKSLNKSLNKNNQTNNHNHNHNSKLNYQFDQLKSRFIVNNNNNQKSILKVHQNILKVQQNKQSVKNYQYSPQKQNNINSNNLNDHNQLKTSLKNKQNKQLKEYNSPIIQQKALIYKKQLKRMKSNKNLIKSKPMTKPKFQKSTIIKNNK